MGQFDLHKKRVGPPIHGYLLAVELLTGKLLRFQDLI